MTISKEDVFAACRELEEQGEKLTNRKVAAHLGAGGTENIRKSLKAYLEERDQFEAAPDGIRSVFMEAADRYWAQALSEAAKRYEGERQELLGSSREAQEDATYLSQKLDEARARNAEVTEERDEAVKDGRAAQEKAKGLQSQLASLRQQLASEKSRADTLERLIEGGETKVLGRR